MQVSVLRGVNINDKEMCIFLSQLKLCLFKSFLLTQRCVVKKFRIKEQKDALTKNLSIKEQKAMLDVTFQLHLHLQHFQLISNQIRFTVWNYTYMSCIFSIR